MNSPLPPIVLHLELDRRSDPITGAMHHPALGRIAFSGWLGLAAALTQLTAADDSNSQEVPSC